MYIKRQSSAAAGLLGCSSVISLYGLFCKYKYLKFRFHLFLCRFSSVYCWLLSFLILHNEQRALWLHSWVVKEFGKKNERKKKPPSCGCSAERRVSRELDLQYEMSVSHTCFVLSFFARSLLLPPTPTFQKHQCYCVRTWIFSLLIYIIAVL